MTERKMKIDKAVYERAKARYLENNPDGTATVFYLTDDDKESLFGADILYGYGLYGCKVYEEDGEYVCRYEIGSSCD